MNSADNNITDTLTESTILPDAEQEKEKFSFGRFIKMIPKYTKIVFFVFVSAVVIHITAIVCTPFSDFFTENIASHFRSLLATLTGWIPFSLAETILLMSPVLIVFYFIFTFHHYIKNNNSIRSLVFAMLSFAMILYSVAVFTFFTGYSNSTLDKKLGIEAKPVTSDSLLEAATNVYAELNVLCDDTEYSTDRFSVMPYSISEMSDKLLDAYDIMCQKYPFLHNINTSIKPVAMSEAMSYTHITGVYTFFTGEANIDAAFPDYTLPYTAAHEFAHQRGIARENEANFIAFLVCINSEDAYIRYSGYMNMLKYLLNALGRAAPETKNTFYHSLRDEVKAEFSAESRFFNKYRNSTVSKVSGTINDAYLKLQGTEGAVSYGMVVDLAVAYYTSESTDSDR